MNKECKGIFFDLGGTFRIVHKDEDYQNQAKRRIAELVGTDADPIEFHKLLDQRYEEYRKWALLTMADTGISERTDCRQCLRADLSIPSGKRGQKSC